MMYPGKAILFYFVGHVTQTKDYKAYNGEYLAHSSLINMFQCHGPHMLPLLSIPRHM